MSHRTEPARRLGTLRRRTTGRLGRGQSLVEFALILPVLLLIVLAALDLGRVYLGDVNLQNLARIGANFAANNPSVDWTDDTNARVLTYSSLIVDDATMMNCTLRPTPAETTLLARRTPGPIG